MALSARYHAESGIVETIVSGVVDPDELRQETVLAASMAEEHEATRFLSNFSAAVVGFSISDVFDLPALQEEVGLTRGIRVALLPPAGDRAQELAQFYETVCMNRGWLARVFADRTEAMDWLKASALE